MLEAIEALQRRSLIEHTERSGAFTPQSVVLEYITDRMVDDISREIQRGPPAARLVAQPLIKALAKDYVRQSQERLIGAPVIQRVAGDNGNATVEQRLLALLEGWRDRPEAEQGYGPGNVVNLLRLLRGGDLRSLDLSRLALQQAYLQDVQAQDASLADGYLRQTVLGNAIGAAVSVALSADGTRVAAGTPMGEVQVSQVVDARATDVGAGTRGRGTGPGAECQRESGREWW